jgi:hypothetical protein
MKTKMDIFIAEGVSPHIASSRSIDRETDRALKALGYAR